MCYLCWAVITASVQKHVDNLKKEKEPGSTAHTKTSPVFIISEIAFLLPLFYILRTELLRFFLRLEASGLCCYGSAAPLRGQTWSPEDITDKECQVSGVVQPNPSDKWKYTASTYLAIKHIFPWKTSWHHSARKFVFQIHEICRHAQEIKESMLIMRGVEGGTVLPLLSGGIKVIFVYWIKVKIGLHNWSCMIWFLKSFYYYAFPSLSPLVHIIVAMSWGPAIGHTIF